MRQPPRIDPSRFHPVRPVPVPDDPDDRAATLMDHVAHAGVAPTPVAPPTPALSDAEFEGVQPGDHVRVRLSDYEGIVDCTVAHRSEAWLTVRLPRKGAGKHKGGPRRVRAVQRADVLAWWWD